MRDVLDKFGGGLPQSMIPSVDRPGSYMRLEELLRNSATVRELKPDQHHPDKLFKERWPTIRSEWTAVPHGELSDTTWGRLCDLFRSDKDVVEHKIRYHLSLEEHASASAEVQAKLEADGRLDLVAESHVRDKSGTRKSNVEDVKQVLRDVHGATSSSLHGLHKSELLLKVVEAANLKSGMRIDEALRKAAEASAKAREKAKTAAKKLVAPSAEINCEFLSPETYFFMIFSFINSSKTSLISAPQLVPSRKRGRDDDSDDDDDFDEANLDDDDDEEEDDDDVEE